MAAIKTLDRIVKKWDTASAAATGEYQTGIETTDKDWAKNAAAAEKNYNAGVQAAIGRGSFGKGVSRAGHAAWRAASMSKGVSRWAQGISASLENYRKGFEPYRAIISNLTLPDRGPKGDAKNIERVRVVASALHAAKVARG